MHPSMKTVMRTRYWARFTWRLGVALVLFFGVWSARADMQQLVGAPLTSPFTGGGGPGLGYWMAMMVAGLVPYAVIAALMLLAERFVVRWLAPEPHRGCARCGYPTPANAGTCPECGLGAGPGAP
jgi:hypothetical protein